MTARRSFPLVVLFVLTAACAVLAAMFRPLAITVSRGKVEILEVVGAAVGGGMVTGLIGMAVGFFHLHRLRGVLAGGLVGAFLGGMIGPLTLAPSDRAVEMSLALFAGSALIVAAGAAWRITLRD